jgi:CheY-like chemotaxis protein
MQIDNFENLRILVADDDKNTVTKIRSILEENGCRNITCKSKILALTELQNFELVILDIVWRGNTKPKYQQNDNFGISAAKYLREISPNCKVILMSKYFYELDQLKEIIPVCTDFFSSNGDATEIFRTIMKVASISGLKSKEERELFSREVLLVNHILKEVDGDIENKPSLVGISNEVHADLLRSFKTIAEKQNRENATLLGELIDNIAISLTDSTATISTSFRELLQEIKLMAANDPKIQMNFNGPVSGVAGNVEGDLLVNPPLKTPEEAAKEIRDLLTYLQKSNPTDIESAINQEIIRNPTFKSRLRNALKEAGLETAKIIFAPFGIGLEAFRGWRDAE